MPYKTRSLSSSGKALCSGGVRLSRGNRRHDAMPLMVSLISLTSLGYPLDATRRDRGVEMRRKHAFQARHCAILRWTQKTPAEPGFDLPGHWNAIPVTCFQVLRKPCGDEHRSRDPADPSQEARGWRAPGLLSEHHRTRSREKALAAGSRTSEQTDFQ